MISVNQIWESRRRGNRHRVLGVSDCGTRLRDYRLEAAS